MQLMPQTAAALAANPFDPAENIDAGSACSATCSSSTTAAPTGRWRPTTPARARWTGFRGVPPYRETQLYVDRVIRDYLSRTAQKDIRTPSG